MQTHTIDCVCTVSPIYIYVGRVDTRRGQERSFCSKSSGVELVSSLLSFYFFVSQEKEKKKKKKYTQQQRKKKQQKERNKREKGEREPFSSAFRFRGKTRLISQLPLTRTVLDLGSVTLVPSITTASMTRWADRTTGPVQAFSCV